MQCDGGRGNGGAGFEFGVRSHRSDFDRSDFDHPASIELSSRSLTAAAAFAAAAFAVAAAAFAATAFAGFAAFAAAAARATPPPPPLPPQSPTPIPNPQPPQRRGCRRCRPDGRTRSRRSSRNRTSASRRDLSWSPCHGTGRMGVRALAQERTSRYTTMTPWCATPMSWYRPGGGGRTVRHSDTGW